MSCPNTDNAIDQKSANTDAYGKNIYGITMGCKTCENNICNHRLYRIDVGSSRSFDLNINTNGYDDIINIETENEYLYSRTPQILKIGKDKKISIIKSKMKNTRIHQPRKIYEEYISNLIETELGREEATEKMFLLFAVLANFEDGDRSTVAFLAYELQQYTFTFSKTHNSAFSELNEKFLKQFNTDSEEK